MTDLDLTEAIEAVRDALYRGDGKDLPAGLAEVAVHVAAPIIERAMRERVAAEIQAHADEYAPIDGNEAQRRVHRHLQIAARVAAPDPTLAEIVEALENAGGQVNETAPKPFMIGEQGPEEFPGTGFGAAQPQIDRMAAEGFEIVPAVQKAPETALRATQTGERASGDAPLTEYELISRLSLERDRAVSELERLREHYAGWVDPEEAARLRSDYWRARKDRSQFMGERDEARATKDMHKERAQQAIAERDALLPVVEAARAYERAWTEFADGTVPPSDADQWTRVRVAKAQAHQVLLDSTRALDSGTREESTDG